MPDVELNKTTCLSSGITCLNSDQRADRSCPDFKVRYVCTCPCKHKILFFFFFHVQRWKLASCNSVICLSLGQTTNLSGDERKIPNFKGPFWRGLSTEGNLRFKVDWASHITGSKFTFFPLFYFVFEGNFPSTSPQGAYIWRGNLTDGFFALPVWGAYISRGLYMEGLIFGILRYVKIVCWARHRT